MPLTHRFSIRRSHLEPGERRILPIYWAQDNGNNPGFFSIVSLQCPLHFNTITIFRTHESWTDQQQNNLSSIQVSVNFTCPIGSWANLAVMPVCDDALSPQIAQVLTQFFAISFVFVRVGDEALNLFRCLCHVQTSSVRSGMY